MGTALTFSDKLSETLTEKASALPADFNQARFVTNAVALLNENENLAKFAKQNGTSQIVAGLVRGAVDGLDFAHKEAYLVPFGNQLNFMPSYKGARKMAKKYALRPVKDIYADIVREGDNFECGVKDGKPYLNFTPNPFSSKPVIGAFAVVIYEDESIQYEIMNMDDLEACKNASRSSNSPAWKKFTNEMYKKSVLHRLCKNIEIDPDINKEILDDMDAGLEIETDQEQIVENEINENQGSEEFIEEDVIDTEVVAEQPAVEELAADAPFN